MRQPPWSLVRHVFLELRWLMPAGQPWQAGAGLLGLFVGGLAFSLHFFFGSHPSPFSLSFLFFVFCFVTTQLADQLHQERLTGGVQK